MSKKIVNEHIGQQIKALRRKRNITQVELSQIMKSTYQQIQHYEKGRNNISASKLWHFSDALKCDVSYFFDGLNKKL